MAGVRTAFELVVGLGNVGTRYAATRHNAGFWYVDGLAERFGESFRPDRKSHGELAKARAGSRDIRLLKPTTLMNHSGRSVAAVAKFLRIAPGAVLVAHDDLDLPAGSVRLKLGGGHGGHNGLRDVDAQLGSRDYWRLRIGIGHPRERGEVIDYVLNRPMPEERQAIEASIDRALGETGRLLIEGDAEGVMHALHTRG